MTSPTKVDDDKLSKLKSSITWLEGPEGSPRDFPPKLLADISEHLENGGSQKDFTQTLYPSPSNLTTSLRGYRCSFILESAPHKELVAARYRYESSQIIVLQLPDENNPTETRPVIVRVSPASFKGIYKKFGRTARVHRAWKPQQSQDALLEPQNHSTQQRIIQISEEEFKLPREAKIKQRTTESPTATSRESEPEPEPEPEPILDSEYKPSNGRAKVT